MEKKELTAMAISNGHVFVGKPVYKNEVDGGVVIRLTSAYKFDVVHVPVPQGNQLAIITQLVGMKVGEVSVPVGALTSIFSADSPIYQEYVRLRTGVEVQKPDAINRIKH